MDWKASKVMIKLFKSHYTSQISNSHANIKKKKFRKTTIKFSWIAWPKIKQLEVREGRGMGKQLNKNHGERLGGTFCFGVAVGTLHWWSRWLSPLHLLLEYFLHEFCPAELLFCLLQEFASVEQQVKFIQWLVHFAGQNLEPICREDNWYQWWKRLDFQSENQLVSAEPLEQRVALSKALALFTCHQSE